ncbi:OLC1v1005197C1 [Oldenlandia corymbosa var. corymbosa]|uniref:OLC1v1005197C1 n=1 Tax=Oldenlandia corymbosa var. corymbosa TaxID=529605 RepID=A0AAV1DET8_OLDCO|nr:OLC1v1005197C1 [Oldenlandia corymbosa var. corymbosa]
MHLSLLPSIKKLNPLANMGPLHDPFLISSDSSNLYNHVLKVHQGGKRKRSSCRKPMSKTRVFRMKKRRANLDRQIRRRSSSDVSGNDIIERKVRTLKKLIPNGESKEIDVLFLDAAEYILALKMRVKAMEIMVNVLSSAVGSSNESS